MFLFAFLVDFIYHIPVSLECLKRVFPCRGSPDFYAYQLLHLCCVFKFSSREFGNKPRHNTILSDSLTAQLTANVTSEMLKK